MLILDIIIHGIHSLGSPQSLTHHKDRDTVLLTWSSPVVASNYPVEFQYEVIILLINNNSQVITYNITNNTSLNISREDIPDDYDVCSQYYWSVRSVVGERKSMIVQANETFSIPSGIYVIVITPLGGLYMIYSSRARGRGYCKSDTAQL